ncbi:MAG: cheY2 [Clostridia bacterium]|jgi:two-component system chemotaxis response regulator CheY|nr:cheY2 [Clostridia bacterium]
MKKILIVDDAAFMRMAIRTMLEKDDFEIVGEAENGLQAIKKYKECKPDVVTMDITMPEMDGLAALEVIMQYDPNAKVIMLSAMGQEVMVKDAIIRGAKTFVVKPFKEDHIIKTINKVLAL